MGDYIQNTALEILPFLIAAVVIFCCFRNEKLRNGFFTRIRKLLKIGSSSSSQQSTDTLREGSRRLSITENRLNYESTGKSLILIIIVTTCQNYQNIHVAT